jgi:hypothetical protein
MTSGWVCTCEGLAVDLQVDPQNDATFNSDHEFQSVPLRLFSPSAESTPAFIVASFSSILGEIRLPTRRLPVAFCRKSPFLYFLPRDK